MRKAGVRPGHHNMLTPCRAYLFLLSGVGQLSLLFTATSHPESGGTEKNPLTPYQPQSPIFTQQMQVNTGGYLQALVHHLIHIRGKIMHRLDSLQGFFH